MSFLTLVLYGFLFIIGFEHLTMTCLCTLFHVSCPWSSLRFQDVWVYSFHQIGEVLVIIFRYSSVSPLLFLQGAKIHIY